MSALWDDHGYPHRITRTTAKRVFVERGTRDERSPLTWRDFDPEYPLGELSLDRAKLERDGQVYVAGYRYPSGFLTIEDRSSIANRAHRPRVPDPTCSFCDQPDDGGQRFKVGAEEADRWVHARCHAAFCQRNEARMEAEGYVHGIRMGRRP